MPALISFKSLPISAGCHISPVMASRNVLGIHVHETDGSTTGVAMVKLLEYHKCHFNGLFSLKILLNKDFTTSHLQQGSFKVLHPANERRRYVVTPSLIGWVQAQNQPCVDMLIHFLPNNCLFVDGWHGKLHQQHPWMAISSCKFFS